MSELRRARESGDWQSYLQGAESLNELLNGSPASLVEIARAEAHLGHAAEALGGLRAFVHMGQCADALGTLPDFAALRQDTRFKDISAGCRANNTPISAASTHLVVPDSKLLAEDIDYDTESKRFFISSVLEKKVVSIDLKGQAADFCLGPDSWPVLAIKVDSHRGHLWATEVALEGFNIVRKADWGRSAVLCYDLRNGRLLKRIEGPPHGALGDMALTRDGNVIVSDGAGGGVYRLHPGGTALERVDKGDFISPQTPALHPDGRRIFVPDYARGIGILDIESRRVDWIPMQGQYAMDGIDGLYFSRGYLIAVQNGTSPERVIEFKLNESCSAVTRQKVIERATETLGDPTHGVIIDGTFYYIANSGWSYLDDAGNIKPGSAFSPARIMRWRMPP